MNQKQIGVFKSRKCENFKLFGFSSIWGNNVIFSEISVGTFNFNKKIAKFLNDTSVLDIKSLINFKFLFFIIQKCQILNYILFFKK